jgi:hypothetical protein
VIWKQVSRRVDVPGQVQHSPANHRLGLLVNDSCIPLLCARGSANRSLAKYCFRFSIVLSLVYAKETYA